MKAYWLLCSTYFTSALPSNVKCSEFLITLDADLNMLLRKAFTASTTKISFESFPPK